MASMPMVLVAAGLAWLGMKRGWGWLVLASVFVMGVAAAASPLGRGIYSGYAAAVLGVWDAIVAIWYAFLSVLNGAFR